MHRFVILCIAALAVGLVALARVPVADAQTPEEVCAQAHGDVTCGPGNGRQTEGGGEKVSHKGWPAITGVLWQVRDSDDYGFVGGPDADELLGHHGSDRITGGAGRDVIWGDWDPEGNSASQRDTLRGGDGNDFIYPSHGRTKVLGGAGKDYVWAFYGSGTIDCGPGKDTVRIRLSGAFKVKNCETVNHFCAFGSDGKGGCKKPSAAGRRR